jgi:hypothetical protein
VRAPEQRTAGEGWDVVMLEDGELLFSRLCADERSARFVADSFKQNLLRTGWNKMRANQGPRG